MSQPKRKNLEKPKGIQESWNSKYLYNNFLRKITKTVGILCGISIGCSILLFMYFAIPVEYSSDFIRLEYQRIWNIQNTDEFEFCAYDGIECEIILSKHNTRLFIRNIQLKYLMTTQEYADLKIEHYSTLPNLEYQRQNEIMIDGYAAIQHHLNRDMDDGLSKYIEMYVVRGNNALQISIKSGCGYCLRNDMTRIMQVVDSIEFVD